MNNPKTNTKLFKILNRNVNDKNLYTVDEIQNAFSKENCSSGTQREQEIYFKFGNYIQVYTKNLTFV